MTPRHIFLRLRFLKFLRANRFEHAMHPFIATITKPKERYTEQLYDFDLRAELHSRFRYALSPFVSQLSPSGLRKWKALNDTD